MGIHSAVYIDRDAVARLLSRSIRCQVPSVFCCGETAFLCSGASASSARDGHGSMQRQATVDENIEAALDELGCMAWHGTCSLGSWCGGWLPKASTMKFKVI